MRLFMAMAGEVLLFGSGFTAAMGDLWSAIGLFLGFTVCVVALSGGVKSR